MNRRKHTSSLGFPSLVLLAIAVIIVSSSGIGYVVMKNRQITTRSKIAAVQEKMDEHQVWDSVRILREAVSMDSISKQRAASISEAIRDNGRSLRDIHPDPCAPSYFDW